MIRARSIFIAIGLMYGSFAQAQCPTGDVLIASQADLAAYTASFGTCDTLPGDLRFEGYDITDFTAFDDLVMIQGDLINYQTYPAPLNFVGFEQLTSIGGDLIVFGCQKFQDLEGLGSLQQVGGSIDIAWCDSLQSLSGLYSLSTVGGDINIEENNHMLSANGFPQLDTVHGQFLIHSASPSILSYTVPNDLKHVGDDLTLALSSITNITGGNTLFSVGGGLTIVCAALQNISGLNALNVVGDYFFLYDNLQLTSITGFQSLDTIVGWFHFEGNDAMTILNGFPSLDVVVDRIWFEHNPSLTAIHGFPELDSIGKLLISYNPVLVDLQAFDQEITLGQLQINNNALLSYCHVQAVCDHIESNYASINANAPNCATVYEVYDMCFLSTSVPDGTISHLGFYPNPVIDELRSDPRRTDLAGSVIMIYDAHGRLVFSDRITNASIDVSDLTPGHYSLLIENGERLDRARFIKE